MAFLLMRGNNASELLSCVPLQTGVLFLGRQVVRVRGCLYKGVLRPLATTDLEGQQRAKFSLTGAATGVLTSNLAATVIFF